MDNVMFVTVLLHAPDHLFGLFADDDGDDLHHH